MTTTTDVPYPWRLRLQAAFLDAVDAGYGVIDSDQFEAYPGMENAAADFIQSVLLGPEETR